MKKDILILGSGVSGLSCGVLLLRRGHSVSIWAKDFPPNTTSNMAGAFWYAFERNPKEKSPIWALNTLNFFKKEILPDRTSGVIKRKIVNVRTSEIPERWWNHKLKSFRKATAEELPKDYTNGYAYESLLIDTSIYIDYLVKIYRKLGGKMAKKTVTNVNEPLQKYNRIINCTGLGSITLFHDDRMYPLRGQVVRVKPNGLDHIIIDDSGPNNFAMAAPRINDIVLGGTRQPNRWDTRIDPKDTQEILQKAVALSPLFRNVEIVGESVGIRPERDAIRLEAENYSGKVIIHNYGHGGSGFGASWGCAQNVLELVEKY